MHETGSNCSRTDQHGDFLQLCSTRGPTSPQVLPHPAAVGAEQRRAPAAIAGLYIDAGAVQIA